jgi:energy-coupling factor transport system ATP-binding protein
VPAGTAAGVAVHARGWGWRHGTRKAWAVRGLDLRIEPGERVMLLGPSGAGKSTLLAGLAGLLDPAESGGDEEGELLLAGVPARVARVQGVQAGQARTGLLLQDPQAQTVLARCGDDVAFGLENHAVPTDRIWAQVAQSLREVGFPYDLGHSTAALSGGERQRLALAGVLALRPGLLLLDEPTAMLDPDGADQVRRSVAEVLALTGAGCILVEHRVAPWLPLIDRVVVLEPGGGIRADGSPQAVFAAQSETLSAAGVWVPGVLVGRSRSAELNTPGSTAGLVAARPAGAGTAAGLAAAEAGSVTAVQETAVQETARQGTAVQGVAGPAAAGPGTSGARLEAERLLTAAGLAARRPGQSVPAVRDLDFSVTAGRALCVVGPNGAGKSTLALTVAGLVRPAAGSLVAGPSLDAGAGPSPSAWRAGELVSRIGTVFQEPQHQFVASTVAAELAVGPQRVRGPHRPDPARTAARTDELLERLRLTHLVRANPFTLSGGEQRRLSVATVLATAPKVLVLDEPTFGQDARTWVELTALLTELMAEGAAIMVATHDQELIAELGHPDLGAVLAL